MKVGVEDKTYTNLEDLSLQEVPSPTKEIPTTMREVLNHINETASVVLKTPFQGTGLQISKNENQIFFCSRAESLGARIAQIDRSSEEIVCDDKISNNSLWTIALSQDDRFIYASGEDPVIKKYSTVDLSEVDSFSGHTNEVNKLIITESDDWMLSASDDGSARLWSVKDSSLGSVIVHQGGSIIYSMDLSINNTYLCAGSKDGNVVVYEMRYNSEDPSMLVTNLSISRSVWAVKISPNCNFLATGDQYGQIDLFKFHSWDKFRSFSHQDRIRDIDISLDESLIVSASNDNTIKIWDFYQKYKEITLTEHKDWVKRAIILKNQAQIVSISDDKSVIISRIPEFENQKSLDAEGILVEHMWYSASYQELQAICKYNQEYYISAWTKRGLRKDLIKLKQSRADFMCLALKQQEIIVAGRATEEEIQEFNGEPLQIHTLIHIYSLELQQSTRSHLLDIGVQSLCVTGDSTHCIIGETFKVSVWNYTSFTKIQMLYAQNSIISAVHISSSNLILLTCGGNELKKFELNINREGNQMIEKSSVEYKIQDYLRVVQFSDDDHFIYLVTDICFQVFYANTFELVVSIDERYLGLFRNLNMTLCLYGETWLDFYSVESFQLLSRIDLKSNIKRMLVSQGFKHFYYEAQGGILRTGNPLVLRQIKIIGERKFESDFRSHVMKVTKGNCREPYLKSKWLVEPIHINLLHIYAFFNQGDLIREALFEANNEDRVAFISSSNKITPLSISIYMGFTECTHSIITAIRKLVKADTSSTITKKLLFQIIEESLFELNSTGYKAMHKLYKDLLVHDTSYYLPNFCSIEIRLPMIIKSDYLFPSLEEFKLAEEIPEYVSGIKFKKTLARFYTELGSQQSLNFMCSIRDCSNKKIFDTEIIKLLLKIKWDKTKWYMWGQAFCYVWYLILLCLYCSNSENRTKKFLAGPFVVSVVLSCYELIFVFISVRKYFSDFWNIVDFIRTWLVIIYSILSWSDYFTVDFNKNDDDEKYLLSAIILISWLRGITYFRINSRTRYLIKVIFQVCIDIVPFLLILYFSIVGFALMFRAFNSSNTDDFFPYLTESYMIIIGNWDNPSDPDFYTLILFFATLLNPIISLNLLIAILGDTYEYVNNNQIVADAQELCDMIIEIETLMVWNRQKNDKHFIQLMEEDALEDNSKNDYNKILYNIFQKVDYLGNDFDVDLRAFERLNEVRKRSERKLDESLDLLYREIKH